MNKFDKLFLTGTILTITPVLIVTSMFSLSFLTPGNKHENIDRNVIYDTIEVKKVVYDTIKIKDVKPKKTEVKVEVKVEESKKDSSTN